MTLKEFKDMINNISDKFDDAEVKISAEDGYKLVSYARGVVTPNGNVCCVEINSKN
jgi:hypothetical protein